MIVGFEAGWLDHVRQMSITHIYIQLTHIFINIDGLSSPEHNRILAERELPNVSKCHSHVIIYERAS